MNRLGAASVEWIGMNALLGLYDDVVDEQALSRSIDRFREKGILLPTFAQLADPRQIDPSLTAGISADAADPANLFRVHWHNDASRTGRVDMPDYLEVPSALTGVEARILIVFGNRFPMIRAHKVLAAYACLAPRVVSGSFDPTHHRAIWPSTGNYARGGVAISRIMGTRGVAVLPEGMSRERFQWLEGWIASPDDVIRTQGTESNVKEIYDACRELARDPDNVVLNQFSEFGNHLIHFHVTGPALEEAFAGSGGERLAAFVAASGSAGTLGAGDYLKERHGARIVAVEALECPTMLYNGFGEHNIQGIGDKHIPLIHNAMNTDDAVAITDRATDQLFLLFSLEAGRDYLRSHGVDPAGFEHLGLSSIANILAAIQTAKAHELVEGDVIVTVATDGSEMYQSEIEKIRAKDGFNPATTFGRYLLDGETGDFLKLGDEGRRRIFNLAYYTWVEQQGIPFADFEARRDLGWWRSLRPLVHRWDEMIGEFNQRTGVTSGSNR